MWLINVRQKYFFDACLGEWEITMDRSIVLQTWSCWAMCSAVISFPSNIGPLNSSGIVLNNKASAFPVWSQAASQRGREEKASFLLWDSKFCLYLMTLICWHWKNQLGMKKSTRRCLKKWQGARRETHYSALQNPSLSITYVSSPSLAGSMALRLCLENGHLLLSTQRFPGKSLISFNYYLSGNFMSCREQHLFAWSVDSCKKTANWELFTFIGL